MKNDTGQVSEVTFHLTDETLHCSDSTRLQPARMQSLLVARSLHSRADSRGDGTYPSSTFWLSKSSILNSRVMNSYQQATCKCINVPKTVNKKHAYCHERPASVLNFFLVYVVR